MFASAWLSGLATSQEQATLLLTIHRSLGVTVWAVTVCRLGWRLGFAATPPLPLAMPKIQQMLAKLNEFGLYVLLLIQPLTGIAQSLTRGRPFSLLGWDVPIVMAKDRALTSLLHGIHEISAWALLGLVGAHILAALFHRFVLRDRVFQSMSPLAPSGPGAAIKKIRALE
jgi:cytochrome b561